MKGDQDWLEQIGAYADGRLGREEIAALEAQMLHDPALRLAFIEYLNLMAALEAEAVGSEIPREGREKIVPFAPAARRFIGWAAAAAVVLCAALAWRMMRPSAPAAGGVAVEVIAADGARLLHGNVPLTPGSHWKAARLQLASGTLALMLESGARLDIAGPADMEFAGPMKVRMRRGKVTADVGDRAKGFTIETAQARVVDLGTKFGVDVADSGHTDLVVFQGEVELFDRKDRKKDSAPLSRLVEGEAVRVDARQQLSRIVNVTSGPRGEDWSTRGTPDAAVLITAVRDNLRALTTNNYYRILSHGLAEDVRAFVGQRHEWNGLNAAGIPPWLLGADLVQTFTGDRYNTQLEIVVTLSRPAVLYVFFDDRHGRPAWLAENFTDTGTRIGLENAPFSDTGLGAEKGPGKGHLAACTVWKREVPQGGDVTLGAPRSPGEQPSDQKPYWNWMYGIAAKPLDPP